MQAYPLEFEPLLKQTIWGGRRLETKLNKKLGSAEDYAESWEIVDHGADQSVVCNGELGGQTLKQIITADKTFIFGVNQQPTDFPLLLKYLDCNRVLSVQVHPDDSYALRMVPPDLGKTEAWYIVESEPESLVYAGLKSGVTKRDLVEALENGEAEKVLHAFHPDAGDVIYIPAGTVHALGAGLLVAEIQQSSDTTFRLYDWNRVDGEGNSRELHIQKSLEVTDFNRGPIIPRSAKKDFSDWQQMVRCDKFVLNLLTAGEEQVGGDDRFHLLSVPKGAATLRYDGQEHHLPTGQSVLLPAAMQKVSVCLTPGSVLMEMHPPS
ncbi:MAG: class I mannose-6-phosphate isomerase [Rubripirellula sp.]|nr:class I mannose-6-phosphate isomerase [Rubripirellula sp.]